MQPAVFPRASSANITGAHHQVVETNRGKCRDRRRRPWAPDGTRTGLPPRIGPGPDPAQRPSEVSTGSSSSPGNTENTTPAVSVIPIAAPTPFGTSYRDAPSAAAGRNSSISQRA